MHHHLTDTANRVKKEFPRLIFFPHSFHHQTHQLSNPTICPLPVFETSRPRHSVLHSPSSLNHLGQGLRSSFWTLILCPQGWPSLDRRILGTGRAKERGQLTISTISVTGLDSISEMKINVYVYSSTHHHYHYSHRTSEFIMKIVSEPINTLGDGNVLERA